MKKIVLIFILFLFGSDAYAQINIGTNQEEVLKELGSADAVVYDGQYKETWIYDSIKYKNCEFGADKNLTVIIKFDNNKVINFSYHN